MIEFIGGMFAGAFLAVLGLALCAVQKSDE